MPNENLLIAVKQILTEWLGDLENLSDPNAANVDFGSPLLSLWQRFGYLHNKEASSADAEYVTAINRFSGVLGWCFVMLREGRSVEEVLNRIRGGIDELNRVFQLEELSQISTLLSNFTVQNRLAVLGRKWFHQELRGKINNFVIRALLENNGINPNTKAKSIEQLGLLAVSPDLCEKNAETVGNILQQVIYGKLNVVVASIPGVEKNIDGSCGADIGALSELRHFPDSVEAAVRFREILLYAILKQDKYKPDATIDVQMASAIGLSERETETKKLEALLRLVDKAQSTDSIDQIVVQVTKNLLRQRYYMALLTQYLTLEQLGTDERTNIIAAQKFFNRPKNELDREFGMGSNAEGEFCEIYGKLWRKFGLSMVADSVRPAPVAAESPEEKAGREIVVNLNKLVDGKQITFAALQEAHCFFYPEDYAGEERKFSGDIFDDFNLVTARCYIALLNNPSESVLVTREQLDGMCVFFSTQESKVDSSEVVSFNAAVKQLYTALDSIQTENLASTAGNGVQEESAAPKEETVASVQPVVLEQAASASVPEENSPKGKEAVDRELEVSGDHESVTDEEEERFFEGLLAESDAGTASSLSNRQILVAAGFSLREISAVPSTRAKARGYEDVIIRGYIRECDWLGEAIGHLAKLKMLLGKQVQCLSAADVATIAEAKDFFAATAGAIPEDLDSKQVSEDIRLIIETLEIRDVVADMVQRTVDASDATEIRDVVEGLVQSTVANAAAEVVAASESKMDVLATHQDVAVEKKQELASSVIAPKAVLFPPASESWSLTEEMAALLRGSTPSFPIAVPEVAKTPQEKMRARVSQILGDKLEIFIKKEFQEWLDRGYVTKTALDSVGVPRRLITDYFIPKNDAAEIVAQAKKIVSELRPRGTPAPMKIHDDNNVGSAAPR